MEMEVDKERGRWINPRGADQPLAAWTDEFLRLARRLAPKTQETYQRDLSRFVLPRFGDARIGRLPAGEVENWLNDEIAAGVAPSSVHRHYRTVRRVLEVRSRSSVSWPIRVIESTRRACRSARWCS